MPGRGSRRRMESNGVGLAQGSSEIVGILGGAGRGEKLVQRAALAALNVAGGGREPTATTCMPNPKWAAAATRRPMAPNPITASVLP